MAFPLPALYFMEPPDNEGGNRVGHERRRFQVTGQDPDPPLPSRASDADGVLVARLRQGDERAFVELWQLYAARLADVAYRYLRSTDAAADAVQQTFIAVWETRATLTVQTSLANFLYGAVRNRATNTLAHERVARRYRERMAAEYDTTAFVSHNGGPDSVDVEALAQSVRTIIDTLPERTREIFLMSREDGLAPAEIAVFLGLSTQTVYNQLARAVRALAEGLDETR